ncbi:MAG: NADH-quinone oxidoreductase subunit C [Pseudomonadota bacterium]
MMDEDGAEKTAAAVGEHTLAQDLAGRFGEAVLETVEAEGQSFALVAVGSLLEICRWLKEERGFRYLADVIAVDWPEREKRFEVVYQLYCHQRAECFRLKVQAAENDAIPSVTGLWSGADWPERECHDLMGVSFKGHPDLTRLLLPEEATGHPLRKDYPLRGRDDLGYRVPESRR